MPASAMAETTGLFITHRGERCGVYQFGVRLYAALSVPRLIRWHYAECANHEEFLAVAERLQPQVVLVNFHPFTLAWASGGLNFRSAMVFSIFHEANQSSLEQAQDSPFDVLLCPDPTLLPYDPSCLPVPRFIPALLPNAVSEPETFSIGSFGFGTPGKGFDRLCALVNDQFDTARIRINIPHHDSAAMVPQASIEAIVVGCRRNVTKPGIALEITHNFLDETALLDFLASNTINAFLYDEAPGRGISSCTDYALASGRPIAISRTSMFRHLHGVNPSICVEDRPLRAIATTGTAPLRHHRATYASAAAGEAWNRAILDALQGRRDSLGVPDGRGFNKILDDRSRAAYGSALADLKALAPDMLARKIERADIQQAFVLDTARRLAVRFAEPRILAAGSYEDTAVASLRALGYRIDEADPQVNGLDLQAFYCASGAGAAYDLILCTSVLEHVSDDEGFVRMVGELLAPGGIAVFTVDFSNQYPRTGVRPAADYRLYTSNDLRQRLAHMVLDCMLLDGPDWDSGSDDFEYEGCQYSFASWVFRKVGPIRHVRSTQSGPDGAHWKSLLQEELRIATEHERERSAAEQRAASFAAELERERAAAEQLAASLAAEHERERAAAEQHAASLAAELERERAAAEQRAASLAAEHERERAVAEQRAALLQKDLASVVAKLNRLLQELQLEEGPKALRIVLPVARLIRRAHIRLDPARAVPPSSPQLPLPTPFLALSSPQSPGSAPVNVVRPKMARRLARRGAVAGYKLVRPIARPLAWRLRSFLIDGLSEQVRHLGERIETPSAPPPLRDDGAATEMRRLAIELERTLLTLAMERRPDTWPITGLVQPDLVPTPPRVALLLPRGRTAEVECAPGDLSVSASLRASGGDWEPHIRHYMEAVVRPDWVCLDIGANLGAHTLSLAVLAHEGRVVAFEADESNFELLSRNAGALEPPRAAIESVHVALWNGRGTLVSGGADELAGYSFVAEDMPDPASIERRLRTVVDAGAIKGIGLHIRLNKVSALPLDAWAEDNPLSRLDLVKLDVKGAEARVIRGADETLRRHRPVLLVEYNPACAGAYFGQSPEALFRELEVRFAAIHALEADGSLTLLLSWDALRTRLEAGKGRENLVCLPGDAP